MENVDLPLVLARLKEDVNLSEAVEAKRVAVFLFPKSVLRRVVGAAARFYDLTFSPDASRTRDLVLAAFFMRALQLPGLVARTVERAFVDDSHDHVIRFFLLLRPKALGSDEFYNVHSFVAEVKKEMLEANKRAVEGSAPPQQTANGARSYKRQRTAAPAMKSAYMLLSRPTVPVDVIRTWSPFSDRPTAWGELITCDDDLRRSVESAVLRRLVDLGHKVTNVSRSADAGDPNASPSISGDEEPAALPPADAHGGGEARWVSVFTLSGAAGGVVHDVSLEAYFCLGSHPLVERFLRPQMKAQLEALRGEDDDADSEAAPRSERFPVTLEKGEDNLWELVVPEVDLPHLTERYLAHTDLYDSFALFAQRVRAKQDALMANAKVCLSFSLRVSFSLRLSFSLRCAQQKLTKNS